MNGVNSARHVKSLITGSDLDGYRSPPKNRSVTDGSESQTTLTRSSNLPLDPRHPANPKLKILRPSSNKMEFDISCESFTIRKEMSIFNFIAEKLDNIVKLFANIQILMLKQQVDNRLFNTLLPRFSQQQRIYLYLYKNLTAFDGCLS